jgi:phenolic acid decarboxylase
MPITKIIIFRKGIHNKPQVNVFYGEDYVRLYFDDYEKAKEKTNSILRTCKSFTVQAGPELGSIKFTL